MVQRTINEITYQGSKGRFIKVLKPLIEDNLEIGMKYVEPFGGGMNVFTSIDANPKIANDINKYNIALWNALKRHSFSDLEHRWEEYLQILSNCETPEQKEIAKSLYNDMKKDCLTEGGKYPSALLGFVAYACSYGGAWWNGFVGFNAKRGENYVKEAILSLKRQVASAINMENSEFIDGSYEMMDITDNTFVYCDPPYGKTRGYKDMFDNASFWDWCRDLVTKPNVKVLISEYSAPSDFVCIWSANTQDKMGKNTNTKVEKLFIHKSQINKFNLSSLPMVMSITSENICQMVSEALRRILS